MSKESLLNKEFKESDVKRLRNLVKKDFDSSTKISTGYSKKQTRYKEGDVWEDEGKTWTIVNGLKQNVTKLDAAKKEIRVPLSCPKCKGPMKHHTDKKMYKIHKMCFGCVISYEDTLKQAGLYEQYEKSIMNGNKEAFAKDIEQWALDSLEDTGTFVTEQGDTEDWSHNSAEFKKKVTEKLKDYLNYLKNQSE